LSTVENAALQVPFLTHQQTLKAMVECTAIFIFTKCATGADVAFMSVISKLQPQLQINSFSVARLNTCGRMQTFSPIEIAAKFDGGNYISLHF
jgi:hypothetical protein